MTTPRRPTALPPAAAPALWHEDPARLRDEIRGSFADRAGAPAAESLPGSAADRAAACARGLYQRGRSDPRLRPAVPGAEPDSFDAPPLPYATTTRRTR